MSVRERRAERARDLRAACRPAREKLVSLFCCLTSEEQQVALDAINRVYRPLGRQLAWSKEPKA
jgi:hypothetical protein